MAVRKRNLLCIKKREDLYLGHLLLYEPYKNILSNFVDLATKKEAKDFDPVAKVYDGLTSAPIEIRNYYEALLGVTSYYQSGSKGGRGRYIEKKLASSFKCCSLDIGISKIPFWLTYPALHKKKGIFTLKGLSTSEKRLMRTFNWDWIGHKDEETDLGSLIKKEKTIVLMEVKNRVDSGGTSARREVWTSQKFGILLDYFISNTKIYRKHEKAKAKELSLGEMLRSFDIKALEMYIGILFDITDAPATTDADKHNGFFSSSKEGYEYLLDKARGSDKFNILREDEDNLYIELRHKTSNLIIRCGALYGNNVTEKLFRSSVPVSDLLLLRYDDMWLSQLVTISERMYLLKYSKNYTTIFQNTRERNWDARKLYNTLITSEGSEYSLNKLVEYLLENCSDDFIPSLCPPQKQKDEYLADVIQVLAASEA